MSERAPYRSLIFTSEAAVSRESAGAHLSTNVGAQRSGPPAFLSGLSEDDLSEVMASGTRIVLNRGTTVFNQGTPQNGVYLVESGRIRVFYTAPSGKELTLAYWHPGNFVGGPEVFDHGVHVWTGVAAVNSSVFHVPGAQLRKMAARMPALGINLIEGLAFKGKCYSGMAQMLGTRSALERLAHFLLHLADLYGIDEQGGTLIAAYFTQGDIAAMIGATRQWVTLSLKRFAERGVIRTQKSNIVILNSKLLAEIRDDRSVKGLG